MQQYISVVWFFFSIAILLIVLAGLCFYKRQDVSIGIPLVLLSLFLFTCLEPLFAYVSGKNMPGFSGFLKPPAEDAATVGLIVSFFCLALSVGAMSSSFLRPRDLFLRKIDGPKSFATAFTASLVLLLIGLVPYLVLGGTNLHSLMDILLVARSRTGYMQFDGRALGGGNKLIMAFSNGAIVSALLAAYTYFNLKPRSFIAAFGLGSIFIASSILILSGGGRTRTGFIFGTIAIYYLVRKKSFEKTAKIATRFTLFSLFIVLIMATQVQFRAVGWENIGGVSSFRAGGFGFELNRELPFIVRTYQDKPLACKNALQCLIWPIPQTIWLFVTNPIPRVWWKEKPVDPSFGPYNRERTGFDGFGATSNITPTVMGRSYIKYGLSGVFEVGILLGFLIGCVDKYLIKAENEPFYNLIGCMLIIYFMQSIRDFVPGWLYPVGLLIISGIAVDLFHRARRQKYSLAHATL